MTSRTENGITYTQVYDAENRLIEVSYEDPITQLDHVTQFRYDGDGILIKKIKPGGNYVLYIGGVVDVEKSAAGAVLHTTIYHPAAGAMRVDGTLYYILKDHPGSASVVLDEDGEIVGERRYYSFGETRMSCGDMLTDKLFTGQWAMEELGIYHYRARFYSSNHGYLFETRLAGIKIAPTLAAAV